MILYLIIHAIMFVMVYEEVNELSWWKQVVCVALIAVFAPVIWAGTLLRMTEGKGGSWVFLRGMGDWGQGMGNPGSRFFLFCGVGLDWELVFAAVDWILLLGIFCAPQKELCKSNFCFPRGPARASSFFLQRDSTNSPNRSTSPDRHPRQTSKIS